MSRGYTDFTESKIEERIKEGYGHDEGTNYKPWLITGDFKSTGRSTRTLGIKTKRKHFLYSDLEFKYFNILEWDDSVVDIREQYPLFPVTDTEAIADELHYKHPQDPKTRRNIVMTTDFLITSKCNSGQILHARSVKYAKDLADERIREKQAIEELYWEKRNIEWKVVTQFSFSTTKSDNIRDLLKHYENPLEGILDENRQVLIRKELLHQLLNASIPLSMATSNLDKSFGLENGTSLSLFKHLAANKEIPINIETRLLPTEKIYKIVDIEKLKSNIARGDSYCELVN